MRRVALDVHDNDFAGTVPPQGQRVANAAADQKSAAVLVESQSIPSIQERARIKSALVLEENKLAAVQVSAQHQIKAPVDC